MRFMTPRLSKGTTHSFWLEHHLGSIGCTGFPEQELILKGRGSHGRGKLLAQADP